MWICGHLLGPWAGPIFIVAVMVGLALWMFLHSRREPIHPDNVNDEWEDAKTKKDKAQKNEVAV